MLCNVSFVVLVTKYCGYRHHVSVVRAFKHSESERIRAVQQERGHPRKMILWNFARRGLRLKQFSKVAEFHSLKIVRLMGSKFYCRILVQKIQENRASNSTNFMQVQIFSMSSPKPSLKIRTGQGHLLDARKNYPGLF